MQSERIRFIFSVKWLNNVVPQSTMAYYAPSSSPSIEYSTGQKLEAKMREREGRRRRVAIEGDVFHRFHLKFSFSVCLFVDESVQCKRSFAVKYVFIVLFDAQHTHTHIYDNATGNNAEEIVRCSRTRGDERKKLPWCQSLKVNWWVRWEVCCVFIADGVSVNCTWSALNIKTIPKQRRRTAR